MDPEQTTWYDDSDYEYGYDYLYENDKTRPIGGEADRPGNEYDLDDEDALRRELALAELIAETNAVPPDPDEITDTDSAAERTGKLLRREMKAEALRRMEESARTLKDFQEVVAAWDKRDNSQARTIRNHEQQRGDIPLEYGVNNLYDAVVFPAYLNSPMERQLARGYYLDFLAHCPYEMHELTNRGYTRDAIKHMKDDHKELLYFMGIQLYSPQQMAAVRGQSDRNIRKVRDVMLRKLRKRLYHGLIRQMERGYQPTHREEDFLKRYREEHG